MGPRASGKSTIGRALSALLSCPFIDLDQETALRLGAPDAGTALVQHGLDAFRNAEGVALEHVLQSSKGVIALGGGTPMGVHARTLLESVRARPDPREHLLVYLRVEVATLQLRLRSDPTLRPSLTGANPVDEVERVLAEREPVYRALADVEIDAGTDEPAIIAATIAGLLSRG